MRAEKAYACSHALADQSANAHACGYRLASEIPRRAYAANLPVRVNVLLLTMGGFGHHAILIWGIETGRGFYGKHNSSWKRIGDMKVELGNGALP